MLARNELLAAAREAAVHFFGESRPESALDGCLAVNIDFLPRVRQAVFDGDQVIRDVGPVRRLSTPSAAEKCALITVVVRRSLRRFKV